MRRSPAHIQLNDPLKLEVYLKLYVCYYLVETDMLTLNVYLDQGPSRYNDLKATNLCSELIISSSAFESILHPHISHMRTEFTGEVQHPEKL